MKKKDWLLDFVKKCYRWHVVILFCEKKKLSTIFSFTFTRMAIGKYTLINMINGSQLAKMKEYSWHVAAIKFIGMKQLV